MKTRTTLCALALAAMGVSLSQAAEAPAAAPKPTAVEGVKLASLCASCGVVSAVKTETRKGKASGVGAVGGAVAGGVVGNKATDGGTVGTVGGAAVGGLLGNELEKQLKKHKVWVTTVTLKDGSTQKFEAEKDPGFKVGAIVEVGADKQLKAYAKK